MKRLVTPILAAIAAVGFGFIPVAAQTPADFGAAPAGEIPILFNDHHVYAKPDRLKHNRVLAALVRGNTILVPLRSMFEQTGATVSYDPASKTVDVSKPGSDVKVTVGRPEVVINGEGRPLDVPPEIYNGTVVVPLRVISEGMGAYVQWLPERKTVVVRYVAAPPPPTPAPPPSPAPVATQAPTPLPTTTPTPPRRIRYERYLVGDYLFAPKVYNEFSPGNAGSGVSYSARAAIEFPLFHLPWMLAAEYRRVRYPHDAGPGGPGDPGNVTVIGGYGQTYVPAFNAKQTDLQGRFGFKVADPRIYVGVGYIDAQDNYGYPKAHGFGFGLEKLPDLDQTFSLYGSIYDYPSVSADYAYPQDLFTCPAGTATTCASGSLYGTSARFANRYLTYRAGVTIALTRARSPLGIFLDGGYFGDSIRAKSLAPGDASHSGPYAGLGLTF